MYEYKIDMFFGCGVDIKYLFECVLEEMRGGFVLIVDVLKKMVLDVLKSGDLVMVKGFLFMGMKKIINVILGEDKK